MVVIHNENLKSTLAMGVMTFIVVGVTIVSAIPWVRNTHHKSAAVTHLFVKLLTYFFPASLRDSTDLWAGAQSFPPPKRFINYINFLLYKARTLF